MPETLASQVILGEPFDTYVRLGWRIFPLNAVVNGKCTCGNKECASPGKHPVISHWPDQASSEESVIKAWMKQFPNANWGLATGTKSGVIALDVDPRHGGDDSYEILKDMIDDPIDETVTSLTGGGGQHYLFGINKDERFSNSANKLAGLTGLDVRGENGYIVVPPSVHISGKSYEWEVEHSPEEFEILPLPLSLKELIKQQSEMFKENEERVLSNQYLVWQKIPIDEARHLPDLCPWLHDAISSGADHVNYDQWVGMATWAHAMTDKSELFHEWSNKYSSYSLSATEKKWKDTKTLSPYSCASIDGGDKCINCPIMNIHQNPVMRLRWDLADPKAMEPHGVPLYADAIDAMLHDVENETPLEVLRAHESEIKDLVFSASIYEGQRKQLRSLIKKYADTGENALVEKLTDFEKESVEFRNDMDYRVWNLAKKNRDKEKIAKQVNSLTKKANLIINEYAKQAPPIAEIAISEIAFYIFAVNQLENSKNGHGRIIAKNFVDKIGKMENYDGQVVSFYTNQVAERYQDKSRQKNAKKQQPKNTVPPQKWIMSLDKAAEWAHSESYRFATETETSRGSTALSLSDTLMAKALIHDFNIRYVFDELYAYNGQYFQAMEDKVRTFILNALEAIQASWGSAKKGEEVFNALIAVIKGLDESDRNLWFAHWNATPKVAFKNGVYDFKDSPVKGLFSHSPDHQITWSVNAAWDDNWEKWVLDWADNPVTDALGETLSLEKINAKRYVDQFLATSVPNEETRTVLLQYLGYSIARFDNTDQHYAFLYGPGENGKGAFIHTLEKLFDGAKATTSLQELANNRFAAHQILNAAVNLVGDMSGERLENTEILKRITGSDTIEVEEKFKARFHFKPRVKMWFALNELPSTPDVSYGFFRRILIFPFTHRIKESERVENLESKIQTPEALSYLAYLGVMAYQKLMESGEKIQPSKEMKEAVEKYWAANDLVQMAIMERIIEFGEGENYRIPKFLLHRVFEYYAESVGRKPMSEGKLLERVQNRAPHKIADRYIKLPDGTREKVWESIRLGAEGATLNKIKEAIDHGQLITAQKTLLEHYNDVTHRTYPYEIGN